MQILYQRSGGMRPPRDMEKLEIGEDGAFTMWRSVGWATQPPTPVGRFAGRLDAPLHAQLQQEADAAARAGDLQMLIAPDSPVEIVTLEGASASLGIHDRPEGVWEPIIARLRSLLGSLTRFPEAAIALEVLPEGTLARLVYQGREPLGLDLSKLTIRAVLWKDDSVQGNWQAESDYFNTPNNVTAESGWYLDLPLQHRFEVTEGSKVTVYATFEVLDEDWFTPVSLQASGGPA